MAIQFDEENFALTFVTITTVLTLSLLGFQIISSPHQSYLVIYAISDEGNFIVSNATKLNLGDELKLQIVIENHMRHDIKAKLHTVITGDLDSASIEGGNGFTLDEQVLNIANEESSVAKITFSITKARFDENSITIEQVKVNDLKYNVLVESPSRNQTLRLIFNLLIWNNDEKKYDTKWSDGSKDHTSWLQIWFELVPEVEE